MTLQESEVIAAWEEVALTVGASAAIHPSGKNPTDYDQSGRQRANLLLETAKQYDAPQPLTILDYGCGDGRVLRHLPNAYGYDTSPTMITKAIEVGCTATTNPNDLGTYSLTACLAVLIHHDYDTGARILADLVNLTLPTGLIIVDIPVHSQAHTRENWTDVTSWNPSQWRRAVTDLPVEILYTEQHPGTFTYLPADYHSHILRRV